MAVNEKLNAIDDRIKTLLTTLNQDRLGADGGEVSIASILNKLTTLEAELKRQKKVAEEKERRINILIEILLNYTTTDFAERAAISEERDEIDAIAAGLNALADEFQYLMDEQAQNDEKLKAKAQELEATNNDLEAFSYSISHDLRAPLRAILGYSQIMVEDYSAALDEEGARLLSAIMGNANKMSKLINDLLEFSRLGRKELLKMRIDPAKIAQTALAQLTEFKKFDGRVTIHEMPVVYADRSLLMQVYLNLLSNAIKYTSKKPDATIEIGTVETAKGNAYYVKDNGAGFNMKYYDRLFEVFRRLHREKDFDGTGVGLAIVKRIVQRHEGTVWAEGRVNEGATFYFTVGE